MNNKGQVVLVLILVMTVALAIGLSIVQKSLIDVSTSSKVEQSSRAFSAAEAGIEKALQNSNRCANCNVDFTTENKSTANVFDQGLAPCLPGQTVAGLACPESSGSQQAPLEHPPMSREDIANVWLADLNSNTNPPAAFYTRSDLEVFWGTPNTPVTDTAALEITLIYWNGSTYQTNKRYLDQPGQNRNNFDTASSTCPATPYSFSGIQSYKCRNALTGLINAGAMLIRARLLYNTTSQPFAARATGSGAAVCTGSTYGGCYLPPQARAITSTGLSGDTQRKVRLYQDAKAVPSYFDYAIFSIGEIQK